MTNNLLAIGAIFFVGILLGYVLPKGETELQSDENVKEAERIINNKTKVNDY